MNSSSFAFWLAGYIGDSEAVPTQAQWARIRHNLSSATGVSNFANALPRFDLPKKDDNKHLCQEILPPRKESWSNK